MEARANADGNEHLMYIVIKDAGCFGDLQTVETMGYGAAVYKTYAEAARYAKKLKADKPALHVYVAQIVSEIRSVTDLHDAPISPTPVELPRKAVA